METWSQEKGEGCNTQTVIQALTVSSPLYFTKGHTGFCSQCWSQIPRNRIVKANLRNHSLIFPW